MNVNKIEKIKRLIDFRERQRDIAAVDMEAALRLVQQADEERETALDVLNQEHEQFRRNVGKSVNAVDLEFAIRCAKWAQMTLQQKEKQLNIVKAKSKEERDKLIKSHQKVKQMERLHELRMKEEKHELSTMEQHELDDLAIVKEAHK